MQDERANSRRAFRRRVLILLALISAFGAGFFVGRPHSSSDVMASRLRTRAWATTTSFASTLNGIGTAAPTDIELDSDFNEFWDVWRILKEKYYKQPIDDKKLFYGAISGMAASLGDPYTVFFEPKIAAEFSQSLQGKFEGIGAEIGVKDDQLQVIAPLADMPAEKAGIRAGDFILKINGQETGGMPVEKAVMLIRGNAGSSVTLTIGRIKSEKDRRGRVKKSLTTSDIVIVRQTIIVKSVRVKYLKDGIVRIEITHFNQDTTDLFRAAAAEILTKNPKGIILDLRNDPGGYLDRATAVAGEWVGSQLVVQERRQDKITDRFTGNGSGRFKGIPTVVLVNQGSASAAEIVAGALQDYSLAKIVGMNTFGKGSVQDYVELPDKSSFKLTIAEWLTPNGRSIDKVGIKPDVIIDRTIDDINAERDPQLDKAVEILTGKPATPKTAAPKKAGKR
ncbi:MAG: S41 family peptidase [Patescibacteria group bacterium]